MGIALDLLRSTMSPPPDNPDFPVKRSGETERCADLLFAGTLCSPGVCRSLPYVRMSTSYVRCQESVVAITSSRRDGLHGICMYACMSACMYDWAFAGVWRQPRLEAEPVSLLVNCCRKNMFGSSGELSNHMRIFQSPISITIAGEQWEWPAKRESGKSLLYSVKDRHGLGWH